MKTLDSHQPKFKQSNLNFKRGFKSWFYEYKRLCSIVVLLHGLDSHKVNISPNHAEMFYNGGYSPKMAIHEVGEVPVGKDLF